MKKMAGIDFPVRREVFKKQNKKPIDSNYTTRKRGKIKKTTQHERNNVHIEEYETKRKSNLLHIKKYISI